MHEKCMSSCHHATSTFGEDWFKLRCRDARFHSSIELLKELTMSLFASVTLAMQGRSTLSDWDSITRSVKPISLLYDILYCTSYSQYLPARAYVLFNGLDGPDTAALRTGLWYSGQYTILGGTRSSKAVNVIWVRCLIIILTCRKPASTFIQLNRQA